jgi:endo-1,4-beta-D-glucanase Y
MNGNGLMQWQVNPEGVVIGVGAALDADEDMAWALVMADRQWGAGTLEQSYHDYAVDLIDAIWEFEIEHDLDDMPLPGDAWRGRNITNISYFAPAYYRVFGEVSNNQAGWDDVIDRSYEILESSLNEESGNTDNGLVPAWCDSDGVPVEAFDGAPLHFQNDSTRTPFRIGQDYCYFGEPRALEYMKKITSFYTGVGIDNIVDGYELDGTPRPEHSLEAEDGELPASFVGPAAVAASYSDDHQGFVDEGYDALATLELTAGTIYYQKSWTALSLLMLTGNFSVLPKR